MRGRSRTARCAVGVVLLAAVAGWGSGARAAGLGTAAPGSQAVTPISGAISLESTSSAGVKGSGSVAPLDLSSSGTAVAFGYLGPGLDPADTNPADDVYVKDLTTDRTTLASTTDAGVVAGPGASRDPSIDGDGGVVAFQSDAQLDPADTDGRTDIYTKDLASGDTTLVSASDSGVHGNGISDLPSISTAGTKVAFFSDSTNLDPADTDTVRDVYLKNLKTGDIQLVSTSGSGVKATGGGSLNPAISGNGRAVAFESFADNLDPADTDTGLDVYVKTVGTGALALASTSDTAVKGNGISADPSLPAKASKVAFSSEATNLDPADTDSRSDIYVKNLTTGDIALASTSDTGVHADGASLDPQLSANGRFVTFVSFADNLDPADTDTLGDVYVKDLVNGDIFLATTSADGVKATTGTVVVGTSPHLSGTGKHVAFASGATGFDPRDNDVFPDLYVKDTIMCTIVGTTGDDVLRGTSGGDVICGRRGDDTLIGKGGNDILFGEAGDDGLQGGVGADAMDGGTGADTVDYHTAGNSVSVDLRTDTVSGSDADGDIIFHFENATGGPLIDQLTGDGADNVLDGRGDDDILTGGGGADTLIGGDGVDSIDYQDSPAAVTVDLAAGTGSGGDAAGDSIDGVEAVLGSAFDDTLTGDGNDNFLLGMGGADQLDGGAGTDLANYVFSPAGVTINLSNGTAKGGDAAGDVLTSIENVAGSNLDDTLTGDDNPNTLLGLDGDDVLTGRGGDDILTGAAGMDTFEGNGGTNTCDNVAGETALHC
jgi:Tol biopolymer transport system component